MRPKRVQNREFPEKQSDHLLVWAFFVDLEHKYNQRALLSLQDREIF